MCDGFCGHSCIDKRQSRHIDGCFACLYRYDSQPDRNYPIEQMLEPTIEDYCAAMGHKIYGWDDSRELWVVNS